MRDNERIFLRYVRDGAMSVDPEGRVWRHGVYSHGRLVNIAMRRADLPKIDGYRHISVCEESRSRFVQAHRAVWIHFFGEIPEGLEPNHKNGVLEDNHPDNLELLTHRDNMRHAREVLGRTMGYDLSPDAVVDIFLGTDSGVSAATRHGVSKGLISLIRNRKIHVDLTHNLVAPVRRPLIVSSG